MRKDAFKTSHLRVSQGEILRIDVEVYRSEVGRGCDIRIRYGSAGRDDGEDFLVLWAGVWSISRDVDGKLQPFFGGGGLFLLIT